MCRLEVVHLDFWCDQFRAASNLGSRLIGRLLRAARLARLYNNGATLMELRRRNGSGSESNLYVTSGAFSYPPHMRALAAASLSGE